ncbi:MAG: hypothetical protein RR133_01505 [Kiritimatiellia bacterium]
MENVTEPLDDEAEELDLRFVSETQIACAGFDLVDLLNCDEGVGLELYHRLHLTAQKELSLDFDYTVFDEIEDEKFYMLTFPTGTDFADFSIVQVLSVDEISEKCFNDLVIDDSEMSCDGNCDACPQDCIGKHPVE